MRGLLDKSDVIRIGVDEVWQPWYKVTLVTQVGDWVLPAGTTGYIAALYFG